MNGGIAVQLVVDALAAAALYALVGQAVSLAYSGTGVLHLAIGQVGIAGALVAAVMLSAGVPLAFCIAVGLLVGAALSAVAERALVAPTRQSPLLAAVLLIAAALVVQEVLSGLFSHSAYSFPSAPGVYHVFGGIVRLDDLVTIVAVLVTTLGAVLILRGTRVGARLRLTAAVPVLAERLGINTARVRTATFAVGGLLATAALLLGAAHFPIAASGGPTLALRGLGVAAAAGLTARVRIVAVALLIGFVEVFGVFYLGGGGEFVCDAVVVGLVALGWRR